SPQCGGSGRLRTAAAPCGCPAEQRSRRCARDPAEEGTESLAQQFANPRRPLLQQGCRLYPHKVACHLAAAEYFSGRARTATVDGSGVAVGDTIVSTARAPASRSSTGFCLEARPPVAKRRVSP